MRKSIALICEIIPENMILTKKAHSLYVNIPTDRMEKTQANVLGEK
jgi:hypothetical protein